MEFKIYGLKLKSSTDIRYVGRTSETLEIRLNKHFYNTKYSSKKRNHKDYWLLKNEVDIEIFLIRGNIETFTESCIEEVYYIKEYRKTDPLINLTNGGDGGCPGYKHTEEDKKKIGDAHRGKIISEEHKEALRNKVVSEETREKQANQ